MYNIIQLNDKELSELQNIAKELGIPSVESKKKDELVYSILDEQAIKSASKKANSNKEVESQPKKRTRVTKKEGGAGCDESHNLPSRSRAAGFNQKRFSMKFLKPKLKKNKPNNQ